MDELTDDEKAERIAQWHRSQYESFPGHVLPLVLAFNFAVVIGHTDTMMTQWGPARFTVTRQRTFEDWFASVTDVYGRPPSRAVQAEAKAGWSFWEIVID